MAPRSAPLVLRQAGRFAGSLSLRDQALTVGTVLVGAGRYPPPPPLFPLLLRQPATAKLSTRTSRTAVTTNRMRLMAHLLVPISISVPENQEHPKLFPASAFASKLLRSRALWRSRLALSSNAPAGQRDQPHTHRVAEPWRCVGRCAHLATLGRYSPGSTRMTKSTMPLLSRTDALIWIVPYGAG